MSHFLDETSYGEQIALEDHARTCGVQRYRDAVDDAIARGDGAAVAAGARCLRHWFGMFKSQIAKEQRDCAAGVAGKGRGKYGKHIGLLAADKMAVIAMHTIVGACLLEPKGAKVTEVCLAIGRSCAAEINGKKLYDEGGDVWRELTKTSRRAFRPKEINRVFNRHFPEGRWPLTVQATMGARLMHILIGLATVNDHDAPFEPALRHEIRLHKHKRLGVVSFTKAGEEIFDDGHEVRGLFATRFEPMIVPPLPWTKKLGGGYVTLRQPLIKRVRGWGSEEDNEIVREGVNAMNCAAWRINKRVLAVALKLWEYGGGLAGMPKRFPLEKPPLPATFDTDPAAKKAWKRAAAKTYGLNIYNRSLRFILWEKLNEAKLFGKRDRIYFPHQLDFRGRGYALPAFLNHQCEDLCRGLLEFADGEVDPLAVVGGRTWLDVHLANSCGIDKVSFEDRCKWVEGSITQFEGWVQDPLTNTGWMEVDKPFQALAAAYAQFDHEAAAHLPIQVDGSTNALQHYAAMLRCPETADLVNLTAGARPADAYAKVASRVAQLVGVDAAAGGPTALALEGHVDRKLIKQTVMTNTYGVTHVGARRQLYEQLGKANFDEGQRYAASRYLARKVASGVGDVCVAARKAMTWLRLCANRIAKSGQTVRWHNPLGMPVEQPYRTATSFRVSTVLQRLLLNARSEDCPIGVLRQTNAFAPNFVHGIDAAHMACTAIACRDEQITFAAVHDSYWTHAATMPRMSRLLREQFIEVHSANGPLLEHLASELRESYPKVKISDPPATGEFDLNNVLTSDYFFG